MPFPNSDRPVDILDSDVAGVLEANVNSIADAFVDDRGNANATGFGQRLETRGNVNAVAVDVVALDDYVAEIDPDSQNDLQLARGCVRQRGAGALNRKRAVYGIDNAAELDDGTIIAAARAPGATAATIKAAMKA